MKESFKGIIGHEMPVTVLSHLVEENKLPGTLLFSGPGGVGKLATALALAKALHCKTGSSPGCDCPECSAIRAGNHPDVVVVSRDRVLTVEEMREIVSLAQLKTSGSGERVIIFDRAELINSQAANAALKMLEEPGNRTRFILITDTPAMLLPTIRSRSYKLRFSLLSPDEMKEFAERCGANVGDNETIEGIRVASGRPGLLLRWLISGDYRDITLEIRDWMRGVIGRGDEPTVGSMLDWKAEWRGREGKRKIPGYMNNLYEIETKTSIPRGGDVGEIRKWIDSSGKYSVNPINWQMEGKAQKSKKTWSDTRKSLHLAKMITRILAVEPDGPRTRDILSLQDFIRKISWNCSFDIALERLYFKLSGN